MELGELEFSVLRAIRTLKEASSGEIYNEVRKSRNVAYTSVTTTLYRLVDKGLVRLRKESEKRVFYRLNKGRTYRRALANIVNQVVGAFGSSAVSHLIEGAGTLSPDERAALADQVAARHKKEKERDRRS